MGWDGVKRKFLIFIYKVEIMKAKDLAQLLEVIVRKVVREELKPILSEVKKSQKPIIKEIKSKKVKVDPLDINISEIIAEDRKVSKPKSFIKNPMLNEMLNETHQSGEWRNMDGNPYTSNQAQSFMAGRSTAVAPMQDIDGNPVNTNSEEVAGVMNVINKDYSQLMKAIDKKKGR